MKRWSLAKPGCGPRMLPKVEQKWGGGSAEKEGSPAGLEPSSRVTRNGPNSFLKLLFLPLQETRLPPPVMQMKAASCHQNESLLCWFSGSCFMLKRLKVPPGCSHGDACRSLLSCSL